MIFIVLWSMSVKYGLGCFGKYLAGFWGSDDYFSYFYFWFGGLAEP
jgi:hypothetical protein